MPLNASEKGQIAQSFLKCFGEDAAICGRALRFISQFTAGQTNLLAEVQNQATTWQPFIDAGLSIEWWKAELARQYNITDVT
jgi:hypothetical protein